MIPAEARRAWLKWKIRAVCHEFLFVYPEGFIDALMTPLDAPLRALEEAMDEIGKRKHIPLGLNHESCRCSSAMALEALAGLPWREEDQ